MITMLLCMASCGISFWLGRLTAPKINVVSSIVDAEDMRRLKQAAILGMVADQAFEAGYDGAIQYMAEMGERPEMVEKMRSVMGPDLQRRLEERRAQ